MSRRRSRFGAVFGAPLLIALVGAAGLFAALLGDGAWDVLSWIGLGVPAVISVHALLKKCG
ncbi:hypothetical protein PMM47T1_01440 [Pseudomonas sp. M47T1]|uniref:hypothetical protein n=1 Tax=Pseudomonas sp. M47T1 TaxID=1179778 RepID=UPI00026066ED|nr:hypothetical protein [Pseudomonas sp. M47T1]EIK98660.1 hypothetical protein PMM47T1_01440 [Pseudomonas sp. M47T1]